MRYRKPSIKSMGGLRPFLDSTMSEHNGVDYNLFVKLYAHGQGANPGNIAKVVGKSRSQIMNWIKIYETEQGIVAPKS